MIKGQFRWDLDGFGGSGESGRVKGEWSIRRWIVRVISFEKIFSLFGLKLQKVEER